MPIDTIENIIAVIAPQFATDPRLADFIGLAELHTAACYGDKYNYAVALRVCHDLAVEAQNGGAGDGSDSGSGVAGGIVSEKEGDLSRTYGNVASDKEGRKYLSTTKYGLQLMELGSRCFFNPRTSFMTGC